MGWIHESRHFFLKGHLILTLKKTNPTIIGEQWGWLFNIYFYFYSYSINSVYTVPTKTEKDKYVNIFLRANLPFIYLIPLPILKLKLLSAIY